MLALLASIGLVTSQDEFNISNVFGDGMVLQRAPQQAVIWGFGTPGGKVTTTFQGKILAPSKIDDMGVWRTVLPATASTKLPQTIEFAGSDGSKAALKDVLFGDVFICSGQSNMQYTPHSMAGMNNLTEELAAADAYGDTIRFFTVGMDTVCGDPTRGQTDCSKPFRELNPNVPGGPCPRGRSCREPWTRASALALGGNGTSWNTFSAVCWLTFRDVHDALGGDVPIGLISSNWGGTPVQVWQPEASITDCNGGRKAPGGSLYNSMIAPFGPMALKGATWYQGESNVGQASYYACGFPSMIKRWREQFSNEALWFGFVQIANFRYSVPFGHPPRPEIDHSHAAGDLRQAQLTALALPNVGMTTAIDTGDYLNIHPPDKQTPSRRLALQALTMMYGQNIPSAGFPLYAGSKASVKAGGIVTVTVAILASGKPVALTTRAPLAATQSTTLGRPGSVPRNECITAGGTMYSYTFPEDCGYPQIIGKYKNGTSASLNATATIGEDGSSIVLTATATNDFTPTASSYGRASWPRTVFYAMAVSDGSIQNPVIPWFSNFSTINPWHPPAYEENKPLVPRGIVGVDGF